MSQDDPRSDSPARPVAACLDPATLEQLVGLDDGATGLVAELFGLFREDTPERLANMRINLEAGHAVIVSELAHALKGSAGTMGASRMRAIAQEIEKATKGGDLGPGLAAQVTALGEAYDEACGALTAYLSA